LLSKSKDMKNRILKLVFLIVIATCISRSSFAQISKGYLTLGGSLGANITLDSKSTIGPLSSSTPGYIQWNFSPTVGFCITDEIVVGVGLNIDSKFTNQVSSLDNSKTENIMASGIGANLTFRKYNKIRSSIYYHTQVGVGYAIQTGTNRIPLGTNNLTDGGEFLARSISVTVNPGLTYFVSSKWAIDFSLNNILAYTSRTITFFDYGPEDIVEKDGSLSFGYGLTPTLGVFYFLGQ